MTVIRARASPSVEREQSSHSEREAAVGSGSALATERLADTNSNTV